MTTVTIDDELATRLRAVRNADDLDRLVAEALSETVRRWEREAAGRAEVRATLKGPRRVYDPQATFQRLKEKFEWMEDLSHLTDDELADRYEAGLAALPPEKVAEARRLGLL